MVRACLDRTDEMRRPSDFSDAFQDILQSRLSIAKRCTLKLRYACHDFVSNSQDKIELVELWDRVYLEDDLLLRCN